MYVVYTYATESRARPLHYVPGFCAESLIKKKIIYFVVCDDDLSRQRRKKFNVDFDGRQST